VTLTIKILPLSFRYFFVYFLGTTEESEHYSFTLKLFKDDAHELKVPACPVRSIEVAAEKNFEKAAALILHESLIKLVLNKETSEIYIHLDINYICPQSSLNVVEDQTAPMKCDFEGCVQELMTKEEVEDHQKECNHRIIKCSMPSCNKNVPITSLIDHLNQVHAAKLVAKSNNFKTSYQMSENDFTKSVSWSPILIEFQGKQFLSTFTRVHEAEMCYFWVYLIGSSIEAEKYKFVAK
jgi:hypothetical protein